MHPTRRPATPRAALRQGGAAVAAAVLFHALALAVIVHLGDEPTAGPTEEAETAALATAPIEDAFDAVALIDLDELMARGRPLDTVVGPGDQAASDAVHPRPRAELDLPGDQAAGQGGGGLGGSDTWTDRHDDDTLRAQMWNSPDHYRAPHDATGARAATPESIERRRAPAYGDRAADPRRATDGEPAASAGDASGQGDGQPDLGSAWDDRDPLLDGALGRTAIARQAGPTQPTREAPLVDPGARATDAARHGPAADHRDTAGASDETDPMPFDLTAPRAGGLDDDSVRGPDGGAGVVRRGRGQGTAATSADVAAGEGRVAVRAERQDPYFREMYRRLDELVEYPRDLAVALKQGTVIVHLTLAADGHITDLRVVASSGYPGFDDELVDAMRQAGSFGPVPPSLLAGQRSMVVRTPYTFRNPLIR